MSKKAVSVVSNDDRTPTRCEAIAYCKKGDNVIRGYIQLHADDKKVGGFMRASIVLWLLDNELAVRQACIEAIADAETLSAPKQAPAPAAAPVAQSGPFSMPPGMDPAIFAQVMALLQSQMPAQAAPVAAVEPVKTAPAKSVKASPLSAAAARVKASAKR